VKNIPEVNGFLAFLRSNFLSCACFKLQVIARLLAKFKVRTWQKRTSQKSRKIIHFGYIIILSSLIFLTTPSFATTKIEQLNKVSQDIGKIKSDLHHSRVERSTLLDELKTTEVAISRSKSNIRQLDTALRSQKRVLSELESSQKEHQQNLEKQQALLGQYVRAAYQLGKHQYLKVFLNEGDPNKLSRTMAYYGYLNKERVILIKDISDSIEEMAQNAEDIHNETEQLTKLLSEHQHEQNQLHSVERNQQKLLSQINKSISTKRQRLTSLVKNKQALEKVIQQINPQLKLPQAGQSFAKMRGKLHWPTQGRIDPSFGAKANQSGLKYSGVLIKAPEDQDVISVFPGKVVFANWLRGFGLLLIIDHGNGYMTLYGHNNSLYKKAGDTVAQGETIASVGHSGGFNQSGLYVEVRHNGIPENPVKWFTTS